MRWKLESLQNGSNPSLDVMFMHVYPLEVVVNSLLQQRSFYRKCEATGSPDGYVCPLESLQWWIRPIRQEKISWILAHQPYMFAVHFIFNLVVRHLKSDDVKTDIFPVDIFETPQKKPSSELFSGGLRKPRWDWLSVGRIL